jgi:uncharacterized phage protein (TIGR01671 family)
MGECSVREIKFRAYLKPPFGEDEHGFEMVYDLAFEEYDRLNDQLKSVKTLMQYTGLKDKNGVEIYEGDIIRLKNRVTSDSKIWRDSISSVFFKDGMFVVDDDYPSSIDYSMVEVIGNIYENPELL